MSGGSSPSSSLALKWKWKSVVSNSMILKNSPGQNTGVGSLSLLQGIFLTQGSNQGLLHFRWILYQLSYQGSLGADPLSLDLPLFITILSPSSPILQALLLRAQDSTVSIRSHLLPAIGYWHEVSFSKQSFLVTELSLCPAQPVDPPSSTRGQPVLPPFFSSMPPSPLCWRGRAKSGMRIVGRAVFRPASQRKKVVQA